MFEHLDDPTPLEIGNRDLANVLRRAELLRHRPHWTAAVGVSAVLLAASVAFFFARPASKPTSVTADYQFNLVKGRLPVGYAVPASALVDVQFVTRNYGYGLAAHRNSVILVASTDGGASWKVRNGQLPVDLGANAGFPGQFEFVGFTGYIWGPRTAHGAPLWITDDEGATWHQAAIGPYVEDVSAIDLDVWALTSNCPPASVESIGCTRSVAVSLDGGATWTQAPLPQSSAGGQSASQSEELARITKTHAYVLTYSPASSSVGTWGLDYTADGGASWVQRAAPCAGPFGLGAEVGASSTNDLWLLCGSQATAGSQSKQLFRSTDGGLSWKLLAQATGLGTPPSSDGSGLPLAGYVAPFTVGHRNLAIANDTHAWLYPSRANLYVTSDGGLHWALVSDLAAAGFDSGGQGNVTFVDATHGWICAYGVGLWHTDDGVHWSALGSS